MTQYGLNVIGDFTSPHGIKFTNPIGILYTNGEFETSLDSDVPTTIVFRAKIDLYADEASSSFSSIHKEFAITENELADARGNYCYALREKFNDSLSSQTVIIPIQYEYTWSTSPDAVSTNSFKSHEHVSESEVRIPTEESIIEVSSESLFSNMEAEIGKWMSSSPTTTVLRVEKKSDSLVYYEYQVTNVEEDESFYRFYTQPPTHRDSEELINGNLYNISLKYTYD